MTKALGTDDSINTCDCCGRTGLKFTVTMELDCGEIAHYGQVCATRNTGKTTNQINCEIKAAGELRLNAARNEYKSSPEYLAAAARMAQRPRDLLGRAAAEFVRDTEAASRTKRSEIAQKYNVNAWEIY